MGVMDNIFGSKIRKIGYKKEFSPGKAIFG
jgi:hypothetical protein